MTIKNMPSLSSEDKKETRGLLVGAMSPEKFMKLMQRCPNRKEWGFCGQCRVTVCVTETDGQTTQGILDKTILDSIQLEGHVPFDTKSIRSIEIVPPHNRGVPCLQSSLKS